MTPEQFCYWLQGRVEILPEQSMTPEEIVIVKDHLDLVFNKLTPMYKPGEVVLTDPDNLTINPVWTDRSGFTCIT